MKYILWHIFHSETNYRRTLFWLLLIFCISGILSYFGFRSLETTIENYSHKKIVIRRVSKSFFNRNPEATFSLKEKVQEPALEIESYDGEKFYLDGNWDYLWGQFLSEMPEKEVEVYYLILENNNVIGQVDVQNKCIVCISHTKKRISYIIYTFGVVSILSFLLILLLSRWKVKRPKFLN